uniref:Putative ixodes 8-cys protein n=1 Tax=Ixodes ricinus TaxID=34613 RepID=A0A0K8RB26_IXORI
MFKLKFFILFVLAGLCFGDTSASETGSRNSEGENNSSGATGTAEGGDTSVGQGNNGEKPAESPGDGKSRVGDEATAGETSDGKNDNEKTFQSAIQLPPWIKDPKNFMDALLKLCDPHHKEERINKESIDWNKCEYTCRHYVASNGHIKKLPDNTPCGIGKKCKDGTCVEDPITFPSCR